MDIKNKNRAIQAIKEYEKFEYNLDILYKMKAKNLQNGSGLLIQEHSDASGLSTDYFYKEGDYMFEMTDEILDSIISVIEKYRKELFDEIKTL